LKQTTSLTQAVAFARRWHSTSVRLLLIHAAVFSLSVMVLLGVIGWAVTGNMERETDAIMNWQLVYFDSVADSDLSTVIRRRIEFERMHTNYYGLFMPDHRYLAGDVTTLPPHLPSDGSSLRIRGSFMVAGATHPSVVRAKEERRADGSILVVARDVSQELQIRSTIINALVVGGLLCLGAGLAGALALSVRQMRRVAQIRRVTQRISQGYLSERLPIGGRDELDMLAHLVNRMLEEVERLMSEVKGACDGIAHDLRTPLTHVCALLERIEEHAGRSDDERLAKLVIQARGETDALHERFRAMLRISEIGAMTRQEGFGEVQLEGLVREVGTLYEPLADDGSTTLSVEVAPVQPIRGDRALLFEMLTNIVNNAIKFTPPGGAIRIAVMSVPGGARMEVVDDGPGIPEDERHAVLQPFYRAKNASRFGGSGLGLSIVSAVVRVHDFSMRIADAEPGTRVTIDCWPKTLA
jgi:signal transduction histidine kinase